MSGRHGMATGGKRRSWKILFLFIYRKQRDTGSRESGVRL